MKKVVFSLLTTLISLFAVAQESQTGYNFLRIPVSAHAGALGGDNITLIEDDPSLMFNNPALLGSVSDKSVGLNFMTYMKGAFTASASYNKTIGERATVGVMGQFVNYGSMKEVDENNVQIGEFSAKDIAVSGALSYELTERIVGGITAKFITSHIAGYNSIAMGVDLGVNYFDPVREWSLSATVKNLGGQLKAYDDNYEKMPIDIQIGMSKRLVGSPFRLSATLVDLNHWNKKFTNHLVAGIDIIFSPQFYVAAGYNFRRAEEMSIIPSGEDNGSSHGAGLSLGAGIMLERFKLNLSYAKYHVSSNSLMVNVAFCI